MLFSDKYSENIKMKWFYCDLESRQNAFEKNEVKWGSKYLALLDLIGKHIKSLLE